MKSLLDLWCVLARDVSSLCSVSTQRDVKTAARRFEHEGLSFLTITLPSFARGLEQALERGKASPDLWPRWAIRGSTPRFLGEMLDNVFDRGTGVLLNTADADCIWGMRQLSLVMSKIELPCAPHRIARAAEAYVECEKEVREVDSRVGVAEMESLSRVFTTLFGDILSEVDREVYDCSLIPRHGSGATADRVTGNRKLDQTEWPDRLERYFPYGEYAVPNWRYSYLLDAVDFLEPGRERPVKVVFVPKTMKTPRVIAEEPVCMQYTQQALMRALVPRLEQSRIGRMIGFTEQEPNRLLASRGSLEGDLATLDLSEASDRVSNQLVIYLLRHWPHLSGAVQACRSTRADVPGHGVIPLAKYASMGSALTFPLEAMVFLSITVESLIGKSEVSGHRSLRSAVTRWEEDVRVFGDDIVAPADMALSVIAGLESYGLKVNRDKSFWSGKFRESCGGDYYAGTNVSVVKVRQPLTFSSSTADVNCLEATVAFRNNLYEAGLWKTAYWLDAHLERGLNRRFPYVTATSSGLGRRSYLGYSTERNCRNLHAPLVKAWVPSRVIPTSRSSGEGALLKHLLKQGDGVLARDHLERSGRPKSVTVRLRWVRPF
jgi:hypothetical protein